MTREELLTKAKPILFNTEMVKAILEGRKTVTRRVIKKLPERTYRIEQNEKDIFEVHYSAIHHIFTYGVREIKPPYAAGDYLYVRETWCWCPCWDCGMDSEEGCCDKNAEKFYHSERHEYGCYGYRASFVANEEPFERWYPSIHMPKEAARLFLKVTDVRVERVQDIMKSPHGPNNQVVREGCTYGCDFIAVWESTVKKTEKDTYGWEANPWVWVIEFERVEGSSQEDHINYLCDELKEREEYCEKCPYKHETGYCEHCGTNNDILNLEAEIYSSQE